MNAQSDGAGMLSAQADGDEAGEEWPDSGTLEKPTPAKLVFECENWETGEGALQDAFPMFDDANVEVVAPGAATKAMPARGSSAKTGDFSPLAIAGIALVALVAAGGIALSLARRRS